MRSYHWHLDTAPRIEKLALGQQLTLQALLPCDVIDADQRRISHLLKGILQDFRPRRRWSLQSNEQQKRNYRDKV